MSIITKIINWFKKLFGIKVSGDVFEETTAYVPPEDFSQEEVEEILDEYNEVVINDREPSKFAVIIGINKYDSSLNADLNGCVNDATGMYEILTETYGFPHDNVRMLTDFRATGSNMFDRIEWLLKHNVPGDELVLHYSGHGSQVRDRNGDELNDGLDEILCPTDLDWDNPFTDDTISWLFDYLVEGVNLTFICDACHSGTMSRSLEAPKENKKSDFGKSQPANPRFLDPPIDIKIRATEGLSVNKIAALNEHEKELTTEMNHVLISGCRDDQTSADAYIDGRWQGALTASLIQAIKNNPNRDWTSIHADIISMLNVNGYSQKPQLNGKDSLVKGRTIFGA